jgi:hypothetical protein
MQEVIMALCKNFGMSLGLQVLDLSQNKLDEGCSKYVVQHLLPILWLASRACRV